MKILFICTAFNSLAQRTSLVLKEHGHAVTVEYALSPELMIEAAELAQPDLIICPFLTKHVPPKVYNTWMTLIVHPGPPGDAGPSAIDWCLIGDMGELEDADQQQLTLIDAKHTAKNAKSTMRSHWGVTVLQAIEAFDAGPVWAFDQFELGNSNATLSKSDLYRGPITRAAVKAVVAAVERITATAQQETQTSGTSSYLPISTAITAPPQYRTRCVSLGVPFLGGRTHNRPLLRASQRDFYSLLPEKTIGSSQSRLSADAIVQRIRSADSQPGVLSSLFGTPLFLYNAHVQRDPLPPTIAARQATLDQAGTVLATREGAVLVDVGADYPLWIGHLRRPKAKADKHLHPKLPAVMALLSMPETASKLGLLDASKVPEWSATAGFGSDPAAPWKRRPGTYQQVWVDIESSLKSGSLIGYINADFYNGAFSTTRCEILLQAIQWTLSVPNLKAIVMLGGAGYFSNGIALNVIEGSDDPSAEGWANINAIDDCVQALLAPKGIVTFAAMRGNAAAGGLAMATAADFVICAEAAVLNPHYRGLGLFGSEWHTYSWYERCGARVAAKFAREMLPMSSHEAKKLGLVDHVLDHGVVNADQIVTSVKQLVNEVMDARVSDASFSSSGITTSGAPWTRSLRPASADASQSALLSEQILRNKNRYLAYLFADNNNSSAAADRLLTTEEHFQRYRKHELDQMKLDFFHPHRNQRFASRCTGFVRKLVPSSTPTRFALHRRYANGEWFDAEKASRSPAQVDEGELDAFDGLAGCPASAAVARLPRTKPEFVPHSVARIARAYSVGQETLASAISGYDDAQTQLGNNSQRSSTSTAPTTPREGSPKPVLSLGDEEAQRVENEAGQHAPNARLIGARPALKRGPTTISFAGTDDAAKARPAVQRRSERTSPTYAASVTSSPTSPGRDAADSGKKPQSKIQRFFLSLGRKGRANPSTAAEPKAAVEDLGPALPSTPVTPVPAVESAKPASWPIANGSRVDAATRQRRRSSISDVLSILQTSPRARAQQHEGGVTAGTKAERRRSWRPTSSTSLSFLDSNRPQSPAPGKNGLHLNVAATPKIVEEPFTVSLGEEEDAQSGATDCLWSCYYSEEGEKAQSRPLHAAIPAQVHAA